MQVKKRPCDGEQGKCSHVEYRTQLSELVSRLRQKCASVRASLETHVRAEEAEIWPLFAEHFTVDEQSTLVGAIIGRTGAVVLQALIPWVMDSFAEDETNAMIESLRNAAKHTRFNLWLQMMVPSGVAAAIPDDQCGVPEASDTAQSRGGGVQADSAAATATGADSPTSTVPGAAGAGGFAGDLTGHESGSMQVPRSKPVAGGSQGDVMERPAVLQHPGDADTSAFRPGWTDIFRMNASQLEAAAASSTPNDKQRQSYLAHHLMVSRFLVAQQQRMQQEGALRPSSSGGLGSTSVAAYGADNTASLPAPVAAAAVETETTRGCPHYRTNCNLIAPCCDKEVPCRICHDEQGYCPQDMDRYRVREMVCQVCMTRQPCAQQCLECKTTMARYYCGVCHIFDDTAGVYRFPFLWLQHACHFPFCSHALYPVQCRYHYRVGIV